MASASEIERENHFARKNIPAVFHMIASSKDEQESEEVYNVDNEFRLPDPAGLEGGVATTALLHALYRDKRAEENVSWVGMLRRMRDHIDDMKQDIKQVPQLSSSRMIDVNSPMYIIPPGFKGNKRALVIGINYVGQEGSLKACHNDSENIKEFLMDVHGFQERDMLVLKDDGKHTSPTRRNILNGMKMLVKRSEPGDVVWVSFSGHGGQTPDLDGDESDGMDETLIPLDFRENGQIVDDDILRMFVKPMAPGVHATVLMDCCHSGTVFDLPYNCGAKEDSMPLDDLNEHRTYDTFLERIEFNDKTLEELVLDDPEEWPDDDDVEENFIDLNKALRKNFTIKTVKIINNFIDGYSEEQKNRLLKSLGYLEELEVCEIQGCKPITFQQLDIMVQRSQTLRHIKVADAHFHNTGKDYQGFIEGLRKHKSVKKYNFDNCMFANKTEQPPYVPKFKKPKPQAKKKN